VLPFCHLELSAPIPPVRGYPETLQTLGEHLKKRRLDLGLLQREVAEQVGASKATLLNWERGRSEPELRFMLAIIRFLGYDPTAPDPTLSIGERLRATRRARGLSRKKVALLLGIDESTLWKWEERGEQGRPARRVLAAVEGFLREGDG
jgi:transcriptional regulator with XRE-family HTH domain